MKNRSLTTMKIYTEDSEMLNEIQRAYPSNQTPPSKPQLVHSALQYLKKQTGTIPTPGDIKTPLERQILNQIFAYESGHEDPDVKLFTYRRQGIDPEIMKQYAKTRQSSRRKGH